MMEVDSDMVEVFQSWFQTGLEDDLNLTDQEQEMIFLHFRMAFVHGRRLGREDMMPLIREHAQDIKDIAEAVGRL